MDGIVPSAVRMDPNRPELFYRGGRRLTALRRDPGGGERRPEDWIASCWALYPGSPLGLSRLADGALLRDAVAQDPEAWLGPAHRARHGDDPAILVKLLDAGELLPVHAHPDDVFARSLLRAPRGKAEAWFTLTAGTVYLGLREPLSAAVVSELQQARDDARLLQALHRVEVPQGSLVWVPPGQLHTFGPDLLVVEAQQAANLSLILDPWRFALEDVDPNLGLPLSTALGSVELEAVSAATVQGWISEPGRPLHKAAAEFFRMYHVAPEPGEAWSAEGFCVLVVVADGCRLRTRSVEAALVQGECWVVPFADGPPIITGEGQVVAVLPPL